MVNQDIGILLLFFKFIAVILGFIFALVGVIMKRMDKILVQLNTVQAEHNIGYPMCINFNGGNNDNNTD